jgi:prevent-host-death family protein
MPKWYIFEARRKLADLIRSSAKEPQSIYNRDRRVAVVVDPDEYDEFAAWKRARAKPSLVEAFADLRRICGEEDYDLAAPPRANRHVDGISD